MYRVIRYNFNPWFNFEYTYWFVKQQAFRCKIFVGTNPFPNIDMKQAQYNALQYYRMYEA